MENKCSVVLGDVNEVTDFDHNSVGYYQTALHKSEKVLCGSWSWAVSQSWLICLSHPGQAWWDPEQFVEFEDSGLSQYSSTHELKKRRGMKKAIPAPSETILMISVSVALQALGFVLPASWRILPSLLYFQFYLGKNNIWWKFLSVLMVFNEVSLGPVLENGTNVNCFVSTSLVVPFILFCGLCFSLLK